ncbi:hypothetical protein M5689_001352 [Euphorbia peplus]|nr:hypothetical protein M5689_001352 [Euphorbia peplus]
MEKSTIRCSGGGGGEVRRIHIVYFLSRMGRVEHPHLIRLHHLNRNGVYLRDVKRWMADLRGKDVAETFSWSYKRRYKNVYVWQDILDDDLITPISDNEYVLKGSEIHIPPPIHSDGNANSEKKGSINEKQIRAEIEEKEERSSLKEVNQISPDNSFDCSTKTSSEICEESPIFGSDRSTLTDDSIKHEQSPTKHNFQGEHLDNFGSRSLVSTYSSLLISKNKKDTTKKQRNGNKGYEGDNDDDNGNYKVNEKVYEPPELSSAKSKNHSNGASKMLRNLITCGAVDTNDAALVSVNKVSLNTNVNNSIICKRDVLGGSAREFGTNWNQQQYTSARRSFDGFEGSKKNEQHKTRFGNSKGVPAAYRPVGAPVCSQCGKSFRPERLHSHMKSCKGLKASAKAATDSVKKTPHATNMMAPLAAISFD